MNLKNFLAICLALYSSLSLVVTADITVFVVPFSLIDVEEVLSLEEDTKTEKDVFQILNRVLDELDESVSRKFVWQEVYYFKKWYSQLSPSSKGRVHRVLRDGQFEIVNGLSAQIDEGLMKGEKLYDDLLNGISFMDKYFGVSIKTFFAPWSKSGHSNSTMSILQSLNFNSIVLTHIHYLVKNQFKSNQHLQFNWGTQDEHLLTHVLSDENLILSSYDFESEDVRQVVDVRGRGDKLVKLARETAAYYRTDYVLLPFGGNFRFLDPVKQYANLEKIFDHINKKVSNIEIKFSTFDEYFAALDKYLVLTNNKLPMYDGDFFPNSRGPETYLVRRLVPDNYISNDIKNLDSILSMAESSFVLAKANFIAKPRKDKIERVIGVKDTHELVSGIDESNDPKMWFSYLYHSIQQGRDMSSILAGIGVYPRSSREIVTKSIEPKVEEVIENLKDTFLECLENMLSMKVSSHLVLKPELTFKLFDFSNFYAKHHPIVFFNGESYSKSQVVSFEIPLIPLSRIKEIQLYDHRGEEVDCQLHKVVDETNNVKLKIVFHLEIEPLGFKTFFITGVSPRGKLFMDSRSSSKYIASTIYSIHGGVLIASNPNLRSQKELELQAMNSANEPKDWADNEGVDYSRVDRKSIFLENDNIKVEVVTATGLIKSIEDKYSGRVTSLNEEFFELTSDTTDPQAFFPKPKRIPVNFGSEVQVRETKGNFLHEVEIHGELFSQKVSLPLVGSHLDTIRIDFRSKFTTANRDILLRFSTNMGSTGTFYTSTLDGRYIQRKSYENVPTASNFYPCYGSYLIRDNIKHGQELLVSFDGVLPVSSLLEEEGAAYSANIDLLIHTTNFYPERSKREKAEFKFAIGLSSGSFPAHKFKFENPVVPVFALESNQIESILDMNIWSKNFKVQASYLSSTLKEEMRLRIGGQYDNNIVFTVTNTQRDNINILVEDIFDKTLRIKALSTFPYNKIKNDNFLLKSYHQKSFLGIVEFSGIGNTENSNTQDEFLKLNDEKKLVKKNAEMEEGYIAAISEDQEMLRVLEKRIKRTKHNLNELQTELEFIPKTSFQAYEETKTQITLTEKNLGDLTDKLVLRMQHLKETQEKLDLVNFRKQALSIQNGGNLAFSNTQMREWEATVHGIVTGAGGMLVVVLLYNLLCVRLDKLPRVPIKWVGFIDEELPLRKSN